jgi:hypothetical protein
MLAVSSVLAMRSFSCGVWYCTDGIIWYYNNNCYYTCGNVRKLTAGGYCSLRLEDTGLAPLILYLILPTLTQNTQLVHVLIAQY